MSSVAHAAQDASAHTDPPVVVSIIVKTLNEEKNIARTLSSIDLAKRGLAVEVIVADSLSTDRTVEIALQHGAKVVQLVDPADRCCGVGAQLGFQVARGEYVMIIDGDMELVSGFFEQALDEFARHPRLAGVGGQVIEMTVENRVFVNRRKRNLALTAVGDVDQLDMGGVYRAQALHSVGYFTHRGLHSYEEMELGCRLTAAGWRLARIAAPSVRHWGHALPRYRLLWRRVKSGYFLGPGEFLRSSLGQPWLPRAVHAYRAYLAMIPLWFCLAAGVVALAWTPWVLATAVTCALALIGLSAVRHRSLGDAMYGFVAWNVFAFGLLKGFWRHPADPRAAIAHLIVQP